MLLSIFANLWCSAVELCVVVHGISQTEATHSFMVGGINDSARFRCQQSWPSCRRSANLSPRKARTNKGCGGKPKDSLYPLRITIDTTAMQLMIVNIRQPPPFSTRTSLAHVRYQALHFASGAFHLICDNHNVIARVVSYGNRSRTVFYAGWLACTWMQNAILKVSESLAL